MNSQTKPAILETYHGYFIIVSSLHEYGCWCELRAVDSESLAQWKEFGGYGGQEFLLSNEIL